jgi:hypothetical protein
VSGTFPGEVYKPMSRKDQNRTFRSFTALLLCLFVGLGYAWGANSAYKAPRTPDGAPDLRGIWEVQETINWGLEGHSRQGDVAASKSVVVDPKTGKIPYRADFAEKRKKLAAALPTADPQAKCYMAGVPRAAYTPSPFQIFQSADTVVIVYQDVHTFRSIPTDGRPHLDGVDFWMGDSRGRWEGETLVVDVSDLNDQTWLDRTGTFHSDKLHVVERYTRTAANAILYQATIEDPDVFTAPWTIQLTLRRKTAPGTRIVEDECYEDQRGGLYHTAASTPLK